MKGSAPGRLRIIAPMLSFSMPNPAVHEMGALSHCMFPQPVYFDLCSFFASEHGNTILVCEPIFGKQRSSFIPTSTLKPFLSPDCTSSGLLLLVLAQVWKLDPGEGEGVSTQPRNLGHLGQPEGNDKDVNRKTGMDS